MASDWIVTAERIGQISEGFYFALFSTYGCWEVIEVQEDIDCPPFALRTGHTKPLSLTAFSHIGPRICQSNWRGPKPPHLQTESI